MAKQAGGEGRPLPIQTLGVNIGGTIAPGENKSRLPQAFTLRMRQVTSLIGAGPMTKDELKEFRSGLYAQFSRGLQDNQTGLPKIQAIKSRVQPVTQAQWHAAEIGIPLLVGEVGGTNLNVRKITKISDTAVEISDLLEPTIVVPREERESTWERFIDRIAEPLTRQAAKLGKSGRPVSIGLSLGQPNRNIDQPHGIDAELLPHVVDADGVARLSNSYAITNWNEIAPEERRVMKAVRRNIAERDRGINIDALVAENDTISAGQDSVSAAKELQRQRSEGRKAIVLPHGSVDGTGDNEAPFMPAGHYPLVDFTMPSEDAGYVNTEDGNAKVADNPVSMLARAILIRRGLLQEEDNKPILERRTGEHLPARLIAATLIFSELGLIDIPDPVALTDAMLTEADNDPALISHIADGKFPPLVLGIDAKQIMQGLAQGLQEQVSQIYGEQLAFVTKVSNSPKSEDDTIILTGIEGSAFNKGLVGKNATPTGSGDDLLTVQNYAESVSADEGAHVKTFTSSGMTGIFVATAVKARKIAA